MLFACFYHYLCGFVYKICLRYLMYGFRYAVWMCLGISSFQFMDWFISLYIRFYCCRFLLFKIWPFINGSFTRLNSFLYWGCFNLFRIVLVFWIHLLLFQLLLISVLLFILIVEREGNDDGKWTIELKEIEKNPSF